MGEALPLCTPNAKESSILAAIGWQREWLAEVPFPFSPNEHALPISFILEQLIGSNLSLRDLSSPMLVGPRTPAFEPQASSLDCRERAWKLTHSAQAALEPMTPLHLVRRFEYNAAVGLSHVGNNGGIYRSVQWLD
jgi:hypothetical protein